LGLDTKALVLTRNPEAFLRKVPHLATNPAIQFHVGDVRSFKFPKGYFSHIIHAATESRTRLNEENPLLMIDTIVQGTSRIVKFTRHCRARKFLLTSSGAVYGEQPLDLTHVPEDYVGAPDTMDRRSAYGEGKRLAEYLCAVYARQYGIETKIARGFAFVGPYLPLNAHFAIGNFIRDGLQGGPILVKGDGTSYRSYLYAADLAIWLWTILFQGEDCRPYNVGSEEDLTIAELAHEVAKVFEPPIEVQIADRPVPGKLAERYVPSTQRAFTELKLQQQISLVEATKRTVRWHAANKENR